METEILRLPLRKLKLLEVNARFMRHETFQRLVDNIRRDGRLTSVPFAALSGFYSEDDEPERDADGELVWEVLSGNHRVKAAIEAGIEEADVMVTRQPLSRQQRIAIQLSHNALVGEDDPATLKQLYEQLQDVDWRLYSGLDDKTLELLENVKIDSLAEANLDFQTVTMTFLPDELERAKEAFAEAHKLIAADEVWLARLADYERTLDALDYTGRSYNVSNIATALMLVLAIFERHRTDLTEGFLDEVTGELRHNGWVPLVSIFGTDAVPADVAATIRRAVRLMRDRGECQPNSLWRALEYWAADYLAGPHTA